MPFTLSHVAAVLPFRRTTLIWSALVLGSMAPDIPYLLGTTEYRAIGHQWPGAVGFTVPASLLALWLFHNVFKRPAFGLLPGCLQLRIRNGLGPFSFGGAARFAIILLSLGIGIATHLAWDAFTHPFPLHGRQWLWLQSAVKVPAVGIMPWFMLLQYVSSLVGLAALGVWIAVWYRNTGRLADAPVVVNSRWVIPLAMFAIALGCGVIRAYFAIGSPHTVESVDRFMLAASVTAMAFFFWEVFVYCVLVTTHQSWIITLSST